MDVWGGGRRGGEGGGGGEERRGGERERKRRRERERGGVNVRITEHLFNTRFTWQTLLEHLIFTLKKDPD